MWPNFLNISYYVWSIFEKMQKVVYVVCFIVTISPPLLCQWERQRERVQEIFSFELQNISGSEKKMFEHAKCWPSLPNNWTAIVAISETKKPLENAQISNAGNSSRVVLVRTKHSKLMGPHFVT